MNKLSRPLFKLIDLIVIFMMVFGSPTSALAQASTDPGEAPVGASVAGVADFQFVAVHAAQLVAFPLDIPKHEEPPRLVGWNAPALDGSGNADVQENVGCMQESAGFGLNCTANDISIARALNIQIQDDGCAYPGDTVTFTADFEVLLTAQARHDVGLWFATDGDPNGDAAKTGTCTAATPAYAPDPPWLDLDGTLDPYPGTSKPPSGVQDTCGDIDANHSPLFPNVTLTVACVDTDGNGKLDLPNCTSWRQPGDNALCTSPSEAVPGAPSKCKCDTGFNVDILVPGQIIVDKVTDPAGDLTSFDFTLTGTPTGESPITPVEFSLTDAADPFKSEFLYAGTYSVVEAANSSYSTVATCDDGSLTNAIDPGAIVLKPGATVTCTFTNKLLIGTLIVEKSLVNDNLGTKACTDFSYTIDGGTAIPFEADCSNSQSVVAGAHTVVEAGVPIDGYTTTYSNCTNIDVPAGGSVTCSITNDDIAVPGLTLDKTATPATYSKVGDIISYSYLVTNSGNVTLAGPVTVTDDKATVTCPAGGLAPGAFMTCTASYIIAQSDLDAGSVKNTAQAHANGTDSNEDSETVTADKNPALSITKVATEMTYSAVGDVIHYTITATNSGNVTLSGVTVTDSQVSDLDCKPANGSSLIPGESIECTATHTVTQADIDAGSFYNQACVDDGTGGADGKCADVTTNGTQTPALSITKVATEASYSAVGDIIHYTIVATNTGNVTLHNVTVTDPSVSGLTCTPDNGSDLAPGASLNCTATHTVAQADLDAGSYYNQACVDDGTGGAAQACASTDIAADQNPALSITKVATETTYGAVGDVIHYTIVATNIGNVTLAAVTVSDPSVSGLACTPANGSSLAPGASLTCTATHTVTQADLDAGHYANTACVDDGVGGAAQVCAGKDVPATQEPHLTLSKSVDPASYSAVGQVLTYTIVATNDGNVTLGNVTVSDPSVSNLTCNPANGSDLAPGGSLNCSATHSVTQADLDAGHYANTACAADGAGEAAEACAGKDVPGTQTPAISLAKTADPAIYSAVGQTITYSYVITNTGNVTLPGPFTISDNKASATCDAAPLGGLAPTATLNCTATYSITQADLDGGSVTNVAVAHTTYGGHDVPSSEATATVTAVQNPALSITKVAAEASFSAVGDVIHYTIVATNEGNVTLHNVTVTDPSVTGISCAPSNGSDLAPGATMTCTATHTVAQADLDAGHYANTACVDDGEGGAAQACANKDVAGEQNPALSITKVAMESGYSAVGDVIHYTIVATNTGNVTLASVTVTDVQVTDLNCTPTNGSSLPPSESMVCTASHTITQADLDAGSFYNQACADDGPDGAASKCADVNTTGTQTPSLSITKAATESGYQAVGDVIHYTIVATNTGNVTLHNVTVTDAQVSDLACDPGNPVTDLAPAASITCTASHTITQSDLDAGSFYNQACIDDGLSGADAACNDVTTPGTQTPALLLAKTADPATYDAVDQTITYIYVITNTGNVTLPGPFTVNDDKATVTCDAAPALGLAPTATLNCAATYTIMQADLDAGSVTNVAAAHTTYGGQDVASNEATATVNAEQKPALTIVKTATPSTYSKVGDVISYSYKLTNSGNVTLTSPFTISDDKAMDEACPSTPASLAPSASITCTASYTITQTDLDAGSVTNTATGKGSFDGEDVFSNEDSETVSAVQNPAITLTKSADPTLYKVAGDVITYTLVAKNTGNVTLHDVSISDPMLGTLICTPGEPATLAPDGTITCTGTYTIQASDLNVFSITNTATVDGKGPQDQAVSATASATIYRQAGALLPTQTTCQQYAAGTWPAMYDSFTYQVKSNKINSVSPGVIFYYNTIEAPSASFTLNVVETNTLSWKPMLIQDLGQAVLYDANCNKASGVTVTTTNDPYTVKFTVTGATPGATYYIGIKYSPQNLVGQGVKQPYPTSTYSWITSGYAGSGASIPVKYKK